jgi:hypothetical protein
MAAQVAESPWRLTVKAPASEVQGSTPEGARAFCWHSGSAPPKWRGAANPTYVITQAFCLSTFLPHPELCACTMVTELICGAHQQNRLSRQLFQVHRMFTCSILLQHDCHDEGTCSQLRGAMAIIASDAYGIFHMAPS